MTDVSNQNMTKSVFCRSVTGEGQCLAVGGKCRFAHTIDEIRPKLCRFRDRCNRHKDHPKTCKFVHPDEDIYDYAKTHGFTRNVTETRGIEKPILKRFTVDFSFSDDDFPDFNGKKRKMNEDETSCDRSDGYDSNDGVNWTNEQGPNGFAVLTHSSI